MVAAALTAHVSDFPSLGDSLVFDDNLNEPLEDLGG
jgi:hypothetical protein